MAQSGRDGEDAGRERSELAGKLDVGVSGLGDLEKDVSPEGVLDGIERAEGDGGPPAGPPI